MTDLEDLFARLRAHLLIHHEDDDALVIDASPARSPAHLDVLSRRQLNTHDITRYNTKNILDI